MNKFNLHLGDWSGDGHSVEHIVQMQSAKPLADVQNAYLNLVHWLGFPFKEICGEYEEYKMSRVHSDRLVELGVITQDQADEFSKWVDSDDFAELFAATLNKFDMTLGVEVVVQEDKTPSFHYHETDKTVYMGQVGYGLFGF